MRLDELVPEWDFRERHRRPVAASTAAVMAAIDEVTWREVPVFRALMTARSAGRTQVDQDISVLDGMVGSGFTILHRGDAELVFGLVVPVSLTARPQPTTPEAFAQAPPPGSLAIAGNFAFDGTTLTTETRVRAGCAASRRRFRVYWAVVRPFSGLIRREWLAAIARRATEPAVAPPLDWA